MIKCAKCGRENQLGHIFCIWCSAKLEFGDVTDKELLRSRRSGRSRFKLTVLFLVIFCAAAAALSLWPASLEGERGTAADFQRAHRKITLMKKSGSVVPQTFSEREVNAYLSVVLMGMKKSIRSGVLSSRVRSVQVSLKPDAIRLSVAETWGPVAPGAHKLGPLEVSYGLTGVPEVDEEGFHFSVRGGKVGHLPLPWPLGYLVLPRARAFFSRMRSEHAFLNQISSIALGEGKVIVLMK